jgi:hypothetical protein
VDDKNRAVLRGLRLPYVRQRKGETKNSIDALTSISFKATKDGCRLFFLWEVLGLGYLISNEQDFDRFAPMGEDLSHCIEGRRDLCSQQIKRKTGS